MQLKSSESILICCAGLGMGNASRVVALMESMHELSSQSGEPLHFHLASWGAGFKFLNEYRKISSIAFALTALEDYSAGPLYKLPFLYLQNCRRLKKLVAEIHPKAIVLDSDYHFPAYSRAPVISVGQASDVVRRAHRHPQYIKTWREYLNLGIRERLDSQLQRFFSDLVLVPCFEPGESSNPKQRRIPLIVRKEFLNPVTPLKQNVTAGLLLSGSELEKKPFMEFATEQGWSVLTPGSSGKTVLSNAALIDAFDIVFTQGGLSSISECIARSRFVVVFPIQGHPEQILNAAEVETLGLGMRARPEDLKNLPQLLERVRLAQASAQSRLRPDCNGAAAAARILLNARETAQANAKGPAAYAGLRPSPPNSGAAAL